MIAMLQSHLKARLKHGDHLVPSLEHLAPIDSLYGQRFEYDPGPVDRRATRRYAENGDLAAHDHAVDHLVEGLGRPRHLQTDIEAFLHAETGHEGAQVLFGDIDGDRVSHLRRQVETIFVDVGDDHMPGADVAADGGSHDSDRSCAGDEHILTDKIERQGRMHGVAERIKDGTNFIIDLFRKQNGVEGGKLEVFREGARHVDADALGFRVEVKMPSPRHTAFHADEMAFTRNPVAYFDGAYMSADLFDNAAELVADDHRNGYSFLRPLVPVPDVDVGAADARFLHLDQDLIGA